LTYYFIESPDTEFSYPLFATEEEANYVDAQNGGSGTSHTHVYVDDPTNAVWYMPNTGGAMHTSTAPTNTTNITYNEIVTQNDDLFAPVAFSNQTIGDTSTNPSDTTTVTVYRTNSYGTSQGTLTIIINNTTADSTDCNTNHRCNTYWWYTID